MYARMGDLADKVTAALGSGTDGKDGATTTQGTQASAFIGLSEADVVKSVGTVFTADQKKTGILASVSMAQFILESGYGKSELAQNANNVFGMKCSLSGNTWSGSTWDGKNLADNAGSGNWLDGARFGVSVSEDDLRSWTSGLQ